MSDLFDTVYNPDILTCLASLSNDEVFTPPEIANAMLDLLPQELFKSKETTFLDPAVKSGVFLREIAKRLIEGLKDEIPDLQKRIDHIYHKQIFGIAITELTSLLARRSLYCSKYPNGKYSISHFDDIQGNIRFKNTEHNFKNGKCIFCGVPENIFGDEERMGLELHAYEFIHTNTPEDILKMKFDVIISNPPYQMSDGGGTGDSAKPIYNLFVENAKKLDPQYIIMITPSRWMKGGKGLTEFRQTMINDTKISNISDFEDAKECFPGQHIDGGVSYFKWDKNYEGPVDYVYKPQGDEAILSTRYLKNEYTDTVIRDVRQTGIISKAACATHRFSEIVSYRNHYGFFADTFNSLERFEAEGVSLTESNGASKLYGVKGKKGGAKRIVGYIKANDDVRAVDNFASYKLFFSKAYMTTATVPPEIIVANPTDVCTETFLSIGNFDSEIEAINCLSYIKTKFFRALLFYNRHSLNISKESFSLIPLERFNKPWTDAELYEKYNLTQEEIDFIESMIRPMDEGTDD